MATAHVQRAHWTFVVAFIMFAGACGGNADRGPRFEPYGNVAPRRGGVLKVAITEDARSFDPAIAYDEMSMYGMHFLFDTLIDYAPATSANPLELVPALATAWNLSEDGTLYHFDLRPGVVYSDGQPVVAGDFKYALERILSMADSPFGQFLTPVVGAREMLDGKASSADGIVVIDDHTLEIRLTEPDASFLMVLAMKFATPQKRSHIEAVGKEIRSRPLGTGPFVLKEWDEGSRMVFARNPNYWDPEVPFLDGIDMLANMPRDTGFLKFESGDLDLVDRLSSADYVWIAKQASWQPFVFNEPQMNSYGEKMDCSRPPFSDKRVRQAMNYAVNKDHVIKLLNGRGVIAHGILPPGMFGFNSTLKPYPHDPAKARDLLAQAGYPNGFSIEYVTLADAQAEKLAQSMQADLKAVGIEMTIRLMTFPTYLTASGKRGEVPFGFGSWLMDYPDPSNFMDVKFHSRMIADENANNDSFYNNPEVDRLIDQARRMTDQATRKRLYERLEVLLYDEAPWLWSYHQSYIEVRQPYVMNYAPHPVWIRDYRRTWLDVGPTGERKRR